jgi:hypothetical protein
MKRKKNKETYKGKNIFYRCGCDKKKEREKEKNIENASHLPQRKSVELSKQVNAPTEIIWSDGRVLHISARSHTHIAKKDKQLFCCRQYVLVRNAKQQ